MQLNGNIHIVFSAGMKRGNTCNLLIVFVFSFALIAGFFFYMYTQTNDGAYLNGIKMICEYLHFSISKKK